MRVRVTEWIKENGITPTNEPTWGDEIDSTEFAAETAAATEAIASIVRKASSESALNDEETQKIAVALLEAFQMIPR